LQNARNFRVPIEGHQGLNCKQLGSIRGSIESNWKRKDCHELWPKQNPEHYSLSSSFFPWKSGPVTSFAGTFNAPNGYQSFHNVHETDHQTSLYVGVWSSPAHGQVHETDHQTSLYVGVWSSPAHGQINGRGTTPNRPTQTACSCRFDNLTVHHAYFEPTVGILFIRIKGWKFSLVWKRFPSSTFYK